MLPSVFCWRGAEPSLGSGGGGVPHTEVMKGLPSRSPDRHHHRYLHPIHQHPPLRLWPLLQIRLRVLQLPFQLRMQHRPPEIGEQVMVGGWVRTCARVCVCVCVCVGQGHSNHYHCVPLTSPKLQEDGAPSLGGSPTPHPTPTIL